MESTQDATSDGVVVSPSETFRLRSYQAEMVEESLKSNIIVAMDTGSGKTHMYLRTLTNTFSISDFVESRFSNSH